MMSRKNNLHGEFVSTLEKNSIPCIAFSSCFTYTLKEEGDKFSPQQPNQQMQLSKSLGNTRTELQQPPRLKALNTAKDFQKTQDDVHNSEHKNLGKRHILNILPPASGATSAQLTLQAACKERNGRLT